MAQAPTLAYRSGGWLLTDIEQAQAQRLQAAGNLLATGMAIEHFLG